MIGECQSLAPRKNSLNLFNLIMSLLAGIFMIVACASYSANVKTIQNLSFMVLKQTGTVTYNGKKGTQEYCTYIALQGICQVLCGDSMLPDGTTLPKDDPLRDCATGEIDTTATAATGKKVYLSTVKLYKPTIEALKCSTTTNPLVKVNCTELEQCQNGGNVTIGFAILGCIAALFSMVAFAWRMNSDGVCPKLISVALAISTFVACVVAFAAFQPCATSYYNTSLAAATLANASGQNVELSVRPGVGGAMAVTSFVFFIYVMLMSIFIPSAGPAGADNAGLDNKAPQV
jgi:hypothetical protein